MHQLPEILKPSILDDFPGTTSTNPGVIAGSVATTLTSLIVPLPLHDLYALLRLAVHRLAFVGLEEALASIPRFSKKGMGDQCTCNTPFREKSSVDIYLQYLTFFQVFASGIILGGQQKTWLFRVLSRPLEFTICFQLYSLLDMEKPLKSKASRQH